MFKPPNLIQNNSFSLLHCKWLNWTKTGKPVSQRYPEISQRLKKRRRGPWAKCAWLFLSFLLETLTIITVQLYNLAPLQMRGHPRPDDEVAVSSGDKFTLGWRSTISHSSPGPIWLGESERTDALLMTRPPWSIQCHNTTDSPRIGDLGGCSLSSPESPRPENIRLILTILGPW